MQTLVQVLRSEGRAFKDQKSGRVSKRCICQCVVHNLGEDGEVKMDVGVMVVPEALCPVPAANSNIDALPDVPVGEYMADYGLAIHWQTKELGGVLKKLTRRDPKSQVKQAQGATA